MKKENNFKEIWNDSVRDIAWTLLSYSRINLNLTVSPVIASSFIILNKYFLLNPNSNIDLYMLLISSLFLTCKIEDIYRPLNIIFKAFSISCIRFQNEIKIKIPIEILNIIFSNRDFNKNVLTDEEISKIPYIEINLLNSIKWDMKIDIPFTYFNIHRNDLNETNYSINEIEYFCNNILRNICLVIKSPKYLDIPPEIIAVSSIFEAFEGKNIPNKVFDWILNVKNQNEKIFNDTLLFIQQKSLKCIKIK